MPLAKPRKNENEDDFMDRCMGDSSMVDEFPDNKQRYAVCKLQWDKKEDKNMDIRKAISVHKTNTTDEAWDGPQMKANLKLNQDEAYYKKAFAWQDPDGDPTTKAAYKFIHHMVDGDGNIGAASIKGCQSGIGVLNGGMGGTNIPDADYKGVHKHLAAHMMDGGMEPPELKSLTGGMEKRIFTLSEIKIEKRGDSNQPVISGHAAVFNTLTDVWWYREQVAPGAFKKTIKTSDTRALFNHDPNWILGRNKSGTLKMQEDETGLAVEITPPDTQLIRDMVLTPMERGDISQMSFGFMVTDESWEEKKDEMPIRTINEVDPLFDVSVVTFPAYPTTDAAVRSFLEYCGVNPEEIKELVNLKQSREDEKAKEILQKIDEEANKVMRKIIDRTHYLKEKQLNVIYKSI
jgi:HK97 family phage prohead protease